MAIIGIAFHGIKSYPAPLSSSSVKQGWSVYSKRVENIQKTESQAPIESQTIPTPRENNPVRLAILD